MSISLHTRLWVTLFLILGISGNLLAAPKPYVNTPEQVAKIFYTALSREDCQMAIQLRFNYSQADCRRLWDLMRGDGSEFKNFTITSQTENTAFMTATYSSIRHDASRETKMTGFDFDIELTQKDGSWMITKDSLEQRLNSSISHDSQPSPQQQPESVQAQLVEGKYPYGFPPPLSHNLLGKSIRSVILGENQKLVALTFDLCERENEVAGYDRAVVEQLIKNGVKATFYAGGKWMQSHSQETKELMTNLLFELGNHTWSHGNLAVLHGEEMQRQILKTQRVYEEFRDELVASGYHQIPEMRTVRFPYGRCNSESLDFLRQQQLLAIQWDVVTADPSPKQTAKGIINIVKKQVKPGSIIIAHANGRGHGTAGALEELIPWLKRQGYEFVTVSELLQEAQEVKAVDTCYELVPGDNVKYDRLFKQK